MGLILLSLIIPTKCHHIYNIIYFCNFSSTTKVLSCSKHCPATVLAWCRASCFLLHFGLVRSALPCVWQPSCWTTHGTHGRERFCTRWATSRILHVILDRFRHQRPFSDKTCNTQTYTDGHTHAHTHTYVRIYVLLYISTACAPV